MSLLSAAGLAAVSACAEVDSGEESLDPRVLHGFDGCDDMLAFATDHTLDLASAGGGWGVGSFDGAMEDDGEASGDGEGVEHSTTNVQEAGVDEPDLVKTDGHKILAIARNRLHLVDVTQMEPQLRGSIDLPVGSWDPQLFLIGDRALVIVRSDNYEADVVEAPALWLDPANYVPMTRIIEVDLTNPDALEIVRIQTIGGDYVAARMVDETVRVVLRSYPLGLHLKSPWEFLEGGYGEAEPGEAPRAPEEDDFGDEGGDQFRMGGGLAMKQAIAAARRHNEQVLAGASAENFIPQYVVDDGETASSGLLFGCEDAMRPGIASGMDMLSVVTINLGADLEPGGGVGVFSSGETVYASQQGLYVATHPWYDFAEGGDVAVGFGADAEQAEALVEGDGDDVAFRAGESESGIVSYVHKFDISDPKRADYVASGEVRGWLMSQWSMSEHDGVLRVASTDTIEGISESFVSTFVHEDDALVQLGEVGGLGEGENVYAVRFLGERAFVVTFLQIDPLYTIDLADPAAPTVLGELKIEGYSAYLHPVGDHHLIGIGQDATEQGQTLGTQLSLFDVSDLSHPVRLHQYSLAQGWSEAEYDHHAFLYWEPENLVVLPISAWDEQGESYFAGAMALRVDAQEGIEHLANLQHGADANDDEDLAMPRRAVVVEDRLYTVSELGLLANGIGDFAALGWTEFPG